MTHNPSERRFDELYLKYWDNRISDGELAEFSALLSADPFARDWFRANNLQSIVAADLPVSVPVPPVVGGTRRWSRRRWLQYVGGGLAAGVAAGLAGREFLADAPAYAVRITSAKGGVTVTSPAGKPLPPEGVLPSDATVVTYGTDSSASIRFPDGSDVLLVGDSAAMLGGIPNHLRILRGSAVADVRPARRGERGLSFVTSEALISSVGSVLLTLNHSARSTEVGVHSGLVAVKDPNGDPMGSVRDGELFTVRSDGRRTKQALPGTAGDYSLDLASPRLPHGWHVGERGLTPDGPVVKPESWFDPYHKAEMFQIRSNHNWSPGLFQLVPDSLISVRYRVHTAGAGQVSLVTRSGTMKDSATGVLEWNGRYTPDGTGGWQKLLIRAGDMLDNKEAPRFGAPWVSFLFIFNTYTADLGLEVADFRVSRPGGPVAG